MKKYALVAVIALFAVFFQGCGKAPIDQVSAAVPPATAVQPAAPEPEPEPVLPEIGSLLNGLPMEASLIARRPIAVMLDNQVKARPQAGLSEADVIIEALAEGEITRYMAIFQSRDPETIGPVRSARPYFIDKALEYDAYYVHAGGSEEALGDVKREGVADLDALHEGKATFWRKSHKRAPHNLYTSPSALRRTADARKYRTEWNGIPQNFSYEEGPVGGVPFTEAALHFKEPGKGDSTGYTATFTADPSSPRMMRTVNGKPHLDETTQEPLYAENLIIQLAAHRVIDSEGRLEVALIGSGAGFYCREGFYWPIRWEKNSAGEPTVYKLEDGTALKMKPGILWVEIFPTKKTIEFK